MNHVHVANPYTPICRQYRARTASPRPDLGMRGWTAAPHQESPSAASRQAFCRRGARRRNQACEKVRIDRYRYAAPPDAYPCASIPCIDHSSRCQSLTLSHWRHFLGRPVTQKESTAATCFYGTYSRTTIVPWATPLRLSWATARRAILAREADAGSAKSEK